MSIIRLSTALIICDFLLNFNIFSARLRFSNGVEISDAEEALRLLDVSRNSWTAMPGVRTVKSSLSVIFSTIRLMETENCLLSRKCGRSSLEWDIRNQILRNACPFDHEI